MRPSPLEIPSALWSLQHQARSPLVFSSKVSHGPPFKQTPYSGATPLLAEPSSFTFIRAHTFTQSPALTPELHHGHMGPLTCLTPIHKCMHISQRKARKTFTITIVLFLPKSLQHIPFPDFYSFPKQNFPHISLSLKALG